MLPPGQCLVCGSHHSTCKPAVETWSGRIAQVNPMIKREPILHAKERVYIDHNGKAVGPKDPNRLTLVANVGDPISLQQALEWGLVNPAPIAEEAEKTIAGFTEAGVSTERSPETSVVTTNVNAETTETSTSLKSNNAGPDPRATKRRRAR